MIGAMPVKSSIQVLGVAVGFGLIVLGAGLVLDRTAGIDIGTLTRDPANTFDLPYYTGAISFLGILAWCATATTCTLGALLLRSARGTFTSGAEFYVAAAAITSLLLFDDLFLLHEKFLPNTVGIPELAVYVSYAVAVFAFLIYFRAKILETRFLVLLGSGALLALGLVADRLTNNSADVSSKFLIEDGFKFLGICAWMAYFTTTVYAELQSLLDNRDAGHAERSRRQSSGPIENPQRRVVDID